MYDIIIIGSGPAGMTAGIYAARREMKTLIVGKELGGQIALASEIENYPGFKTIGAIDLVYKMKEQVEALGVEIIGVEIKKIEKKEDGTFELISEKEILKAKTVLSAMGLSPRRLKIKGENEFNGKGVSYCANCDGPLFRDKVVVVVGGGNSALDAAEMLSKIAKEVYLVHRRGEYRAFEALIKEVEERENIHELKNSEITEIKGEERVETITVHNNKEKTNKDIKVDGVFIEVGRIAHTDFLADLVEREANSQIIVDSSCKTKTPGLFAGGDVVNSEYKQITIAIGSATTAALSAYQYLQLQAGEKKKIVLDRGAK
jgi:thioredoxin-disulfide reductase